MFSERQVRIVLVGTLAVVPLLAAGMDGAQAATVAKPHFSHPTRITNKYSPLVPGTEFVYDGKVVENGVSSPHRVTFTVTDLTKVINGVTTVVVLDKDVTDGELQEAELAFFAQDDQGNVWNMGEFPVEYENGHFVNAPDTWLNGVGDGQGGVHVPGHPKLHATWAEGRVPSIRFLDYSKITTVSARTCVPTGCYRNVVAVNEWSPLEPDSGIQVKYYAPGQGLVRVSARGGDSQEFLMLSRVFHLRGAALDRVRAAALRLDRLGYHLSAVYRHSGHARRRGA